MAILVLVLAPTAASANVFEERVAARGLAAVVSASVPDPHPLTGVGENFEIVANLPLDTTGGSPAASDIEMHGNYAFIGSYTEGMVIADISNPAKPKRAGVFSCGGGSQYDVQLSNDGKLAVLSTDSTGATCLDEGESGSMIIDTSDKSKPRMVGFIPIEVGTHTQTLDNRTLYVNNYPTDYSKLEIFDLTKPAQPKKVGQLSFDGEDSIHDSFVDHRPNGRTLLYAASIGYTDVIDVTSRTKPKLLQRIQDPAVSISHQAEPNPSRDTLIVTDEFLGGQQAPTCGQQPARPGEGALPLLGNPSDVGAIHFYKLARDGTIAENGAGEGKYGTYNLPAQLNPTCGCTVHVFWQAPRDNRIVTAWYGRGIHVVDYSDPVQPEGKGYFIPDGADTWAAKPHNGYIFTGDILRGMDVLRYTGEGGRRWPATSGPQDEQRRAYRGVTPSKRKPGGGRARRISGYERTVKLKVPGSRGKRATLTATFRNARGAIVAKLRFKVKRGVRRKLHLTAAGRPGRYRYLIRIGDRGKVLKRRSFRIKQGKKARLEVGRGRSFVCRIS